MSLIRLATSQLIRNNGNRLKCLTVIPVRHKSDDKELDKKDDKKELDKKDDKKVLTFADPVEHAVGLEKFMMLAEERGIDDPFFTKPRKRGPGTKDDPNLVPTFEERRLIGCLCEEDATNLRYLWVHIGDPKRCMCGYWFKAVPARRFWEEIDISMGQ